ncbi:aminotransferase class IV family protein [Protofrankia symbiont of Coriaria ruscifolia]|uniref:Class IV aminotransferase n=1 Tax=Candidatus Protofrankia californiensis TaxID=1839754 RepID=A0A1C3P168_9ACTN|nr:aminotransferase class IV family protein [Protofrankia symbiont of Coriaria ruscifolia]SBW23569.1 class IV aminotransferase [Candidatus Protofrankia californiensis]
MELDGAPLDINDLAALALTNYGHFTTMRIDHQRVRGLSLHLKRLAHDCRLLFDADLDVDRIRHLARRAVAGGTASCMVRITVFDPALEVGHPGVAAQPHVLVTTRPAPALPLPPLRVQSVAYSRNMPAVKHVGLFDTLRYRRAAQLNGFDDVLFTDAASFVSEGATWNIGFFDGNQVIWPDADCLLGVTVELLRRTHERAVTAPVDRAALLGMQAAFATNTAVGVRAIAAVDDRELANDHPIVETLRREYLDIPGEPL